MNIIEQIYNLQKENGKDYKTNPDNFGPSSISGCGLQLYKKKTGQKLSNEIGLPSLLKMKSGTVLHEKFLNEWKEAGIIHTVEKEGEKEILGLKWKYYIDGIGSKDSKDFVLEFKTIYGAGFRAIEEKPRQDHIFQTILYMIAENINDGVILYFGRDNGLLKSFDLELKDNDLYINGVRDLDCMIAFNKAIAKLKIVREAIDNQVEPKAEFQLNLKKRPDGSISDSFQKDKVSYKNPWRCSYCGYYDSCKGKEIADFSESNAIFLIDGKPA